MIERELPTSEARDLLGVVRDIVDRDLAPVAAKHEAERTFPREQLAALGELGLLYPIEYGGGGQPYTVYLQVIEELARGWLTVAESVAVYTLACFPLHVYGSDQQRGTWLPEMI